MTPEQLIKEAAALFQVDQALILSESRAAPAVEVRYAIVWTLRNNGWSVEDIGALLNRDHTTITHALKALRQRVQRDKRFVQKLDQLRVEVSPPRRKGRGGRHAFDWKTRVIGLEERIAALESALLERRAA